MSGVGLALLVTVAVAAPVPAHSAACEDPTAVADARAAVTQQCPCDVTNHGAYVSCAAGVVRQRIADRLLPRSCGGAVKRCAARSTCGKPGWVTCCRVSNSGKP